MGDLKSISDIERIFCEYNRIDGVIHFAASSQVGESMIKPLKYYDNNLYGTMKLLEKMVEHNIKNIVFSSTAATYGEPKNIPILESDPTIPTNTYGETKLTMEKMMKWCNKAYGINRLAKKMEIEPNEIIIVGDSENDISMANSHLIQLE